MINAAFMKIKHSGKCKSAIESSTHAPQNAQQVFAAKYEAELRLMKAASPCTAQRAGRAWFNTGCVGLVASGYARYYVKHTYCLRRMERKRFYASEYQHCALQQLPGSSRSMLEPRAIASAQSLK